MDKVYDCDLMPMMIMAVMMMFNMMIDLSSLPTRTYQLNSFEFIAGH